MIELEYGKVHIWPSLSVERYSHSSVFSGDYVFVAGGMRKQKELSSMEKYGRN